MSQDAENKKNREEEWQKKLLPLMTRMIIVLSAFFFIASLVQVIYLQYLISNAPKFDSREVLSYLTQPHNADSNKIIEETRLKALVMLEGNMADNLYHQGHVSLMARIWTSYIGFVTGMILALVGATFVLGKLRTAESSVEAENQLGKLSFKSASPGLVLAVLGTTLMLATILVRNEVNTSHQAIYLSDNPPYHSDSVKHKDSVIIPNLRPPKNDSSDNH